MENTCWVLLFFLAMNTLRFYDHCIPWGVGSRFYQLIVQHLMIHGHRFFFSVYAGFMPLEVTRKLTDLSTTDVMKMRQLRNLFVYLLWVVVHHVRQEINEAAADGVFGDFLLKQTQRLFHGMRLIAGFSITPVPQARREASSRLIQEFLTDAVKADIRFARVTGHHFFHLHEDMVTFSCHLDANSAYPFESFHQLYKDEIQPGARPATQLM